MPPVIRRISPTMTNQISQGSAAIVAMYIPGCSRQALPASLWVAYSTQKNTATAPTDSRLRRRSANRL